MRLPALFALAALVGLSACDSAKVSELTGAKPATTQIAPTQTATACPPAPTVAPACPPAQPSMPPEAAKTPAAAPAPTAKAPAAVVHRVANRARATTRAWAQRHRVKQVVVTRRHVAQPPVRRFAYAGGYTGETVRSHEEVYVERHHPRGYAHPPVYARPDEAYGRQVQGYERRDERYAQDGYRYEGRETGHAPYVDDRRDEDAYRYAHRQGVYERGEQSYEHRESGYVASSGSASGYSSGGGYSSSYASGGGGAYADDCNCRPQAAGRDRQGFLTWPGKR